MNTPNNFYNKKFQRFSTPFQNRPNNQDQGSNTPGPPFYPSQNPEFISFTTPNQNFQRNPQNAGNGHRTGTPYNNNSMNKQHQFNTPGNYFKNRHSFRQSNFINFRKEGESNDATQDDDGETSGFSNHHRRFNNHRQYQNNRNFYRNKGNQHQNKVVDISEYYHSSMIEDPWKELMERHNAMKAKFEEMNGDDFGEESSSSDSESSESQNEDKI